MPGFAPLRPLPLTDAELRAVTAHLQALMATAVPAPGRPRLVVSNPKMVR